MNLAVIPARGGSKRIPHKNIREFCGRPIIDYSIRAAKDSGVFDQIMVSTDCDEIREIARACGAEVPFMRPADLSDDHTSTIPVIAHAIEWFASQGVSFDSVCCIYATAPFVDASDLRAGLARLSSNPAAEFLLPVTSFTFPIQRALRIEDDRVRMFWPEHENTRSQDLPRGYHDAGQFYWGTAAAWTGNTALYSSHTIPLVIPSERVQDIDTPEDWARAELIFQISQSS